MSSHEGRSLGQAGEAAARYVANVETVIRGKTDQIKLVLATLLCGGHVLLEDVPGTAKTVLARAMAGTSRARRTPRAVHARPPADRRHRPLRLQPAGARLRVPARPCVRERRPRRRDQPRDAEDAVRTPRGDGRAAGHDRRRHARRFRARSSCSPPRTRSSRRAPSRSRRRSSTASSSAPRSATRARTTRSRSSRSSSASIRSSDCARSYRSKRSGCSRGACRTSTSTRWSAAG